MSWGRPIAMLIRMRTCLLASSCVCLQIAADGRDKSVPDLQNHLEIARGCNVGCHAKLSVDVVLFCAAMHPTSWRPITATWCSASGLITIRFL